ncbi:MAG: hypothetical protein IMX00_07475 [Limnochordales bacterium]|nr:hypothetical protein [Limnochordales bacterium]
MELGTLEHEFRRELANLVGATPTEDQITRLIEYALKSGRTKDFLRVLDEQPADLRDLLYERLLAQPLSRGGLQALEKHFRTAVARGRWENIAATVSHSRDPRAYLGLIRVLATTSDRNLSDALLELFQNAPAGPFGEALRRALNSNDSRLQLVAVDLMGRTDQPAMVDELFRFYLRLDPAHDERLRLRAREGFLSLVDRLPVTEIEPRIARWLQDERPGARLLAIAAIQRRGLWHLVPELVRLVLVDPKTRTQAAVALTALEAAGLLRFDREDPLGEGVREVLLKARREPLRRLLHQFMQSESAVLREIGVKFLIALGPEAEDLPLLQRLAREEGVAPVRGAALRALARFDQQVAVEPLVAALTDRTALPGSTLMLMVQDILENELTEELRERVLQEAERLRREWEHVRQRFAGEAEAWREPD